MTESFSHTSLMTAFLAGFLSFASPCVLPLVPSYLMYITGLSLEQLNNPIERGRLRRTIVANSCLFIAGFALVFIAFGASASAIGRLLTDYQDLIRKVGAAVMILFGLHLMGIFTLSFLMSEKRVHLRNRPAGYLGSIVIGATFAAGWTPCVGPVLGTVLLYASTTDTLTDGVTLLAFYALGLGLPLFAAAMGLDRFLTYCRPARPYMGIVSKVSGVVLIIFALVLYDNSWAFISAFFEQHGIGVYIDVDAG